MTEISARTESVWHEFGERLRAFIAGKVDSPEVVDDILQDVFVKIHAHLADLRQPDRLESWVYRIARNTVGDHYRQNGQPTDTGGDLDDLPAEPAPTMPEPLAHCIRPMIEELPVKYRDALLLTEYDGLSQVELAERLGISVSGAKTRVQRARAKIRDAILTCCHVELDRRGNIMDYHRRGDGCHICNPGKV